MSADNDNASSTIPKRLTILGATGSIGSTALELLDHAPEHFDLVAVTAMNNVDKLIAIARRYHPKFVAIGNPEHFNTLKNALADTSIQVAGGESGVLEAANYPTDIVLSAIVGAAGLKPTLNAIRQGARIALANKECLVCAGDLMLTEIQEHNATLIPVDSEHSAIYQVFDFIHPETVEAIILTASGGPFRDRTYAEMQNVTLDEALKHPNWDMGAKITVDSATMMNKGLELIEAYHLFPVSESQIEIIVHPESIIHSMVRYRDGSTLGQMGQPTMVTPIAFALSHPTRMHSPCPPLNLAQTGQLTFKAPDEKRFPALRLAREALQCGASAPIILNAANEIAVQAFLDQRIGFLDITATVEKMLEKLPAQTVASLDDVEAIDTMVRIKTMELLD
ncbi:MAG: 1-deoxy-D-xylulose-5-phosphate reductoisomerase [Alphaproteobacteria bacterium]|nr:1-deoxy-D-xylulose-5-phosphate reductoisomerase [Alphaproteobacteria bacterium]